MVVFAVARADGGDVASDSAERRAERGAAPERDVVGGLADRIERAFNAAFCAAIERAIDSTVDPAIERDRRSFCVNVDGARGDLSSSERDMGEAEDERDSEGFCGSIHVPDRPTGACELIAMNTSKRSPRRVVAAFVVALLSTSAGGVFAGPPTAATTSQGAKPSASASVSAAASAPARTPTPAEEAFARGSQLYMAQKWDEALVAFREAWALQKTYDIAANLGQTEVKLGRLSDAATHLAFAVRSWPVVGKQEARELAKQRFDEVRLKVAAVTIDVNVAGADIVIDGASVGRSPLGEELFVDPGAHRVEVKLAGYEVGRATLDAKAAGTHAVKIELVREGGEASGGLSRGARMGLIVGGAVAGAAGLALGVGFTLAANGKADEADTQLALLTSDTPAGSLVCPAANTSRAQSCENLVSLRSASDTYTNVATGAFVASGILAAGALTLGVWSLVKPATKPTSSLRIEPVVGLSYQGAVVRAAW